MTTNTLIGYLREKADYVFEASLLPLNGLILYIDTKNPDEMAWGTTCNYPGFSGFHMDFEFEVTWDEYIEASKA